MCSSDLFPSHDKALKVIWFSDLGKKFFEKTKASKDYQYMGAFTEEEKEAEIAKLSEVKEKVSAPFKDEVVRTDAKHGVRLDHKSKAKRQKSRAGYSQLAEGSRLRFRT